MFAGSITIGNKQEVGEGLEGATTARLKPGGIPGRH